MNEQEKMISHSLCKASERAVCQKERVKQAIISNIDNDKEKYAMNKKRFWIKTAVTVAAAVLITCFFALTPTGNALAAEIAKLFAPEKPIIFEVEGEQETQDGRLEINTEKPMGYVIYVDGSRYEKETVNDIDHIKFIGSNEGLPPVRMEIEQIDDKNAQSTYDALLEQAKEEYAQVDEKGHVAEPVDSLNFVAYGEAGESPFEAVYVVDNTAGGCFVIRCRMFVEAQEGHGARFDDMLRTFEVVPSDEIMIEE